MKQNVHTAREQALRQAVDRLTDKHAEIRKIVALYGRPPVWGRGPGFASLVYTILEQQVSLASARSVYARLEQRCGGLSAESFSALDEKALRSLGFSRQKSDYCRNLAAIILDGRLDLTLLETETDEAARTTLMTVRGIGKWTADIYLLHSLGRPDIWPAGDLALQVGYQEALDLEERPDEAGLEKIGGKYAPFRSAAARVFWHFYLSRRKLDIA